MRTERIGLIVVNLLLLLAFGLLNQAGAQTMPIYANPDPGYWYSQYQQEHVRAEGLETFGKSAISGLQGSLKAANDTIVGQNKTVIRLSEAVEVGSKENADCSERRAVAETERDRLKGRTWAGKVLRRTRNGLAGIGGVWIAVSVLKLVL